ncbi:MAG: ATP-binding protein [Sedimenticola sp.]
MPQQPTKAVSMSRRLALALAATVTLVVILVAGVFYWYTANEMERNFSRQADETLSHLEGMLGLILWNYDHKTAQWVVKATMNDAMIVGVTIRDDRDRPIYALSEPGAEATVTRSHSIHYQDTLVGSLELTFSRELLHDTLNNILLISLSVWLLALLGIALLTYGFIRIYFRGPLLSFIELAKSYRRDPSFKSVKETPFIEFQPIEAVVKNLADEVFQQLRELEHHRENLELEVSKRTHDLEIARDAAEQARVKAEVANQAKSTFLANMSHELRTPLNAILGFSEMIGRDHYTPPSTQEKVSIINHSGEHLLGMINDILDLSKVEAGRIELEPEAFDLPQMLEDIGRMFEARAVEAGLSFQQETEPELCQFIKSDPGKLRQILINLLGNAIKFTQEGGFSLHARTEPLAYDSDMVLLQFEVEDSGPGIPAGGLQRIFQPFVQSDQTSAKSKGTGLGLAISKSFVELMGGEIGVKSEPGKGTLFRVELPVAVAQAADSSTIESDRQDVVGLEADQPAWRILVVEDIAENRLLLSTLLRQAGFEIREAENGEQAVARFEDWHPHFIWMDMRMPVMDGYQATARIRSLPAGDKVKIVALTASAFKEQRPKIIEAGCNDVLHKPFQSYEFFDVMAEQLGVRYLYESNAPAEEEHVTQLTAEMVGELPEALRAPLHKACQLIDIETVGELIGNIRQQSPQLAAGLQALADNYEWGRIRQLLDASAERDGKKEQPDSK